MQLIIARSTVHFEVREMLQFMINAAAAGLNYVDASITLLARLPINLPLTDKDYPLANIRTALQNSDIYGFVFYVHNSLLSKL